MANNVSSDLPRFRLLLWSKNQDLIFFIKKSVFQLILSQTPIKHFKNQDKPIYALKKPS